MPANVWFEEVNVGLINEIKNTVRYKNIKGVMIPLDSNNGVVIRKPEEDFKFEVFPCVSIYNLDYTHDPLRYNPAPVKVGEDIPNSVAIMEDTAVPFNFTYQIDFWAKYNTDMDSMTRTWLVKHFRQFNLKVVDDGGTERTCNCLRLGSVVKSDLVLNTKRLFHTIIKYQIWVELDEETRYNKSMATDMNFNVKTQE